MKKTYLKRIGKIGKINLKANQILADYWRENGINYCEIGLEGCLKNWTLQNVHRHKRWWYIKRPEMLWDRNEVLRGCQNCHNLIENNEELREKIFNDIKRSGK